MMPQPPLLPLAALALLLVVNPHLARGDAFDDLWNSYIQAQAQHSETSSSSYESIVSRRDRNLDHWDVSAAAAHLGLHPTTLKPLPRDRPPSSLWNGGGLGRGGTSATEEEVMVDEYIGHDAAILFYVQRSNDCHAVAPSWDAIATHVKAGSISSNLVMALFDCERNAKHGELCNAAGVKKYPTIMYVGRGDYHGAEHGFLGFGSGGASVPRRSVIFRGDWRYADQILDWISVMGGLSSWHAANEGGPLRGIRNGLFRLLGGGGGRGRTSTRRTGKEGVGSLPVGVPPNFQTELRGGGGMVSTADADKAQRKVHDLETKLNATMKEKGLYAKANLHSGYLLDGLLFSPRIGDGKNDSVIRRRDPFAILTESDGWYRNATHLPVAKDGKNAAPNDEHPAILRSCTLELIIDYCTRVTNRATNAYIQELNVIPESDPFPTLDEIETRLLEDVKKLEPYCGMIESCVLTNFEGTTNLKTTTTGLEDGLPLSCRPPKCPFVNDAACAYVECCLDPNVQDEYGVALGLVNEGERVLDKDWTVVGKGEGKKEDGNLKGKATTSVGGWGVPAK